MEKTSLESISMDNLTKGKYIQLLACGHTPRDIFQSLAKGTDMKKERLREEFEYWLTQNGIKELKPVKQVMK
ncbi:hypothetical protein [Enterococcus faecium]|uniref:hypothetical protein n=1 Tax=Enterococcus faecium TaxID=1352 RepID=UPI001A0C41A0|nr:hypothetical protein [Enterococcus faecium]EGP5213187.1 hypothetical protein [Enterococcus faecium]EME8213626.1 hypothetical protein [Enterococcus faecium]MDN3079712.1 hypothetical protein [Enterococcus faecium]MDQ8230927.1 hypothetical protein [Enterococcus faecium]MDQ8233420.1 hypothetical protein [Enterococcus faecium]